MLSLGVSTWLHGLYATGLIGGGAWGNGLVHTLRDAVLTFPFAVIAAAAGAWSAKQREAGRASASALLGQAALTALVLFLFLMLTTEPHQLLDRALDGGPAHFFHGQARAAGASASTRLSQILVQGLADAFLAFATALPLAFFCLARRFGERPFSAPTRLGRLGAATALAAAVLATSAAGLVLAPPSGVQHRSGAHAAAVTSVAVGPAFTAGDLEVAVQSAQWVRQPREALLLSGRPAPEAAPDRLYLRVSLRNLVEADRRVARARFQLRSAGGRLWSPIADHFAEILLGPGEALITGFIFELPPEAQGLEFAWAAGPAEAHAEIGDDLVGGVYAALCRALAKPWTRDADRPEEPSAKANSQEFMR